MSPRNAATWTGNFCAVVTPFTESGALDETRFRDNIELLMREGIDGVVVAGHTGEAWALSDEERGLLFHAARDVAADDVTVIGAVSAIRPEDAISLARMAEAADLDGVLLTAPAYAMVSEREIVDHIRSVHDATSLPIMLYNIPRRIGRSLSPALIERLCEMPRVAALKQSSPSFDELSEVLARCGDRLRVFAGGSAVRGLAAAAIGVHGFVSSTETQVFGSEAIDMYRRVNGGDIQGVRDVQNRCARLSRELHHLGTEPAGLKVAMNHLGRPGGHPRRPILPLQPEAADQVRRLVDELVGADSPARLSMISR